MLNLAGISREDHDEEDITSLSAARWKKLFGFNKPQGSLSWVRDLLADSADISPGKKLENDAAGMFVKAYESLGTISLFFLLKRLTREKGCINTSRNMVLFLILLSTAEDQHLQNATRRKFSRN